MPEIVDGHRGSRICIVSSATTGWIFPLDGEWMFPIWRDLHPISRCSPLKAQTDRQKNPHYRLVCFACVLFSSGTTKHFPCIRLDIVSFSSLDSRKLSPSIGHIWAHNKPLIWTRGGGFLLLNLIELNPRDKSIVQQKRVSQWPISARICVCVLSRCHRDPEDDGPQLECGSRCGCN